MPRREIYSGTACFTTHVTTHHTPVFSYPPYSQVVCKSLNFIQERWDILIFGYVLTPDHLHLLPSVPSPEQLREALASFRRFTGKQLLDMLHLDCCKWALEDLRPRPHQLALWRPEHYPKDATAGEVFNQKLDYIHMNPVRTGFVREPEHWRFSSARDYVMKEAGEVRITFPWDVPVSTGANAQ